MEKETVNRRKFLMRTRNVAIVGLGIYLAATEANECRDLQEIEVPKGFMDGTILLPLPEKLFLRPAEGLSEICPKDGDIIGDKEVKKGDFLEIEKPLVYSGRDKRGNSLSFIELQARIKRYVPPVSVGGKGGGGVSTFSRLFSTFENASLISGSEKILAVAKNKKGELIRVVDGKPIIRQEMGNIKVVHPTQ